MEGQMGCNLGMAHGDRQAVEALRCDESRDIRGIARETRRLARTKLRDDRPGGDRTDMGFILLIGDAIRAVADSALSPICHQ